MLTVLIIASFVGQNLSAQVLYSPGKLADDMYSDLISKRVGDLVTIVIIQSAQANQNAQSSKNRSAGLDASASIPGGSGFLKATPSGAGSAKLSGKTERSGTHATTRQSSFIATVTATVEEVMENGNLRIAGRQYTAIDEQETEIAISGIVRPYDIQADNSVLSSALAEAKIEYKIPDADRSANKESKIVKVIAFPFRFIGTVLSLLF